MFDVVTITVNYKMREKAIAMLRSLVRDVAGNQLSVQPVIVDNASGDGIAGAIAREFIHVSPRPEVIASPQNLGFGRGNNLAVRQYDARYYFIVNPDIVFPSDHPRVIERLYEFMEANPGIGIVASRLMLGDQTTQASCMRFPGFLDHQIYRLGLHQRYAWARRRVDRLHMVGFDHTVTQPIDWATGAALFIRGSWLREVSGFDERYFMYFEDCDLCRTFWAHGWPVYYKGDVVLEHGHERASAKVSGLQSIILNPLTRTHVKSWLQYAVKWRGKKV